MQNKIISIALASLFLAGAAAQVAAQAQSKVVVQAARRDANAARAMLLAAATAGSRIVAVGANGYVLLSDDGGASYRQARQVALDFTLTGVWFADANNGWAVGHGGSIIHSRDGGETWQLQRSETEPDQPLFSVYFSDAQHGWASGLWSLLLHTSDGGQSWSPIKLPVAAGQKRADLNLLKIFSGPHDALYIAAEQGTLFRSLDQGEHWEVLKTGSNASLWSGVVSSAGSIVVGGLGGKLLRSSDGGSNWHTVEAGTSGSITSLQARDGMLWAVSLEGSVLQSTDDGVSWKTVSSARLPLTTLLLNAAGKPLLYSKEGPLAAAK
jgi:photosystem II stability/assembly factor-like uncharacterized protein